MGIKRGVDKAVAISVEEIKKASKSIKDKAEIATGCFNFCKQ